MAESNRSTNKIRSAPRIRGFNIILRNYRTEQSSSSNDQTHFDRTNMDNSDSLNVHDFEEDLIYPSMLHNYLSPLTRPLVSGWRRVINKQTRELAYMTPSGERMSSLAEIEDYLRRDCELLSIDQFTLDPHISLHTKPLPQQYLNIKIFIKDITKGDEKIPVICFNTINDETPPPFEYLPYLTRSIHPDISLSTERDFLLSCDCKGACNSSSGCVCRRLTESERQGLVNMGYCTSEGYEHSRLPYPQVSGIFECNQYCGCGPDCGNRVVQTGPQHRLAVFRTKKLNWGVMVLEDVPKGAFLCTYNGLVCSDGTGNARGIAFGDEYLMELDYIDVMEELKEGYEEEVVAVEDPKSPSYQSFSEEAESTGNSTPFSSLFGDEDSMRNLSSPPLSDKNSSNQFNPSNMSFYCVAKSNELEDGSGISSSVRTSCRVYYGEDCCYVVDSKTQGNIGRFINHSCSPNLFVQNIFIDSHDLRFPWVALFANKNIPAFTELYWDYNYIPGSVEGKSLNCLCGSAVCRKKLL